MKCFLQKNKNLTIKVLLKAEKLIMLSIEKLPRKTTLY